MRVPIIAITITKTIVLVVASQLKVIKIYLLDKIAIIQPTAIKIPAKINPVLRPVKTFSGFII